MSVRFFAHCLIGVFVFLLLDCKASLCILNTISPSPKIDLQVSSPILWVVFHFLDSVLEAQVLNFNDVFSVFSFLSCAVAFMPVKSCVIKDPKDFHLYFLFRHVVLSLTFRFLICFELTVG